MRGEVRYLCLYPDCEWYLDMPSPTDHASRALTDAAIREHLNTSHTGWTLEKLKELHTQFIGKSYD